MSRLFQIEVQNAGQKRNPVGTMQVIILVMVLFIIMYLSHPVFSQSTDGNPSMINTGIPFPEALEEAAISVPRLDDILEYALIIGNGDINALVYSEEGNLILHLTKNDVWDARLETENDPPLPTLARLKELAFGDWPDRNWILPPGYQWKDTDSYQAHPYPCPRACAVIRIGSLPTKLVWRRIRAEGTQNSWERIGESTVMSITGEPGSSNGFAYPLDNLATEDYPTLQIRLSGSENARFYVDVMDPADHKIFGSGWLDTPTGTQDFRFPLPLGKKISTLILYTWTEDGQKADNRFEEVILEGPRGKHSINLELVVSPSSPARLDIRRGVVQVAGTENAVPKATLRALANHNVFLIESSAPAHLQAFKASYELPAPSMNEQDGLAWLKQEIPGDPDWPGMSFAVAVASKGTYKAVAIVTSQESNEVVDEAVKLAQGTLDSEVKTQIREHEKTWEEFWAASGIDVPDTTLCTAWYRNLYFLRCVTKPGVVSPGLFAGLINDTPAWHGDYHTNYNIQQTFWSSYITNHPELAEPYDRLISHYLPRARWLAHQIFAFEGAYYPHVLYAYEPAQPQPCRSRNGRQYIHHVWGMTLGVNGFTVQPLWWRYKYQPSRQYLETIAYPAIRAVAIFYANFIEQCDRNEDGKIVLGPSVSPEHWGWTMKFERNRNCTFDIAMVQYILEAAIEGATTLGCDRDLITRLVECLPLLPDYPTYQEKELIVVDVQDAPPIDYNIAVPATPVFPGDVVSYWSEPLQKDLFTHTIEHLRWNGNNSTIILAVARARLSISGTEAWLRDEVEHRLRPNGTLSLNRRGASFNSFGHYTEQFGISMAVSELLLQSVRDIIRVFPAWPRDKPASFYNLRSQGGFLVSASQFESQVREIKILATVGGTLRLASPWPAISVSMDEGGQAKPLTMGADRIVELETRSNQHLIFRSAE